MGNVTDRGRQNPDDPLEPPPGVEFRRLADSAGESLQNLLGDLEPRPGGPYVHRFKAPEPAGWDDDGNPVYPEPGPSYTLTERPVADVVREAGFLPGPERIKITYWTEDKP